MGATYRRKGLNKLNKLSVFSFFFYFSFLFLLFFIFSEYVFLNGFLCLVAAFLALF